MVERFGSVARLGSTVCSVLLSCATLGKSHAFLCLNFLICNTGIIVHTLVRPLGLNKHMRFSIVPGPLRAFNSVLLTFVATFPLELIVRRNYAC